MNRVLINKLALLHNHQSLKKFHPETAICPVLKSNAYGHGLTEMAPLFDTLNCPFLVVDSLYEAYEIYKVGVKTPILILGYTHGDNFNIKSLPFEYAVFDIATAQALNAYQVGCNIHLFLDTGMHREGVSLKELPAFLSELKNLTNLNIAGVSSHFADADNSQDRSFTEDQITEFKKGMKIILEAGYSPHWRHISASGGAFKMKDPIFNLIRAGIAHYGVSPLEIGDPDHQALQLQPLLSFVSTIVQIKNISKGDRVGYNGIFTASKNMTIGLLPAGYYEGVDRRLSNLGFVRVNGKDCRILGRVSMNMTTIDLSQVKNAQVGDDAVVYSDHNQDKNSFVGAAKLAKTIPYELMVHIAASVKRELF